MPRPSLSKIIHFGPYVVTSQVFHTTKHSFCLVNLKPLLPGHVLVSPLRSVPRLSDLSAPEISDLFLTVQKVEKTLGRVYGAEAFNVAIQDGPAAGQSVAHVHAHIIPRKQGDMDAYGAEGEEGGGGGDHLYELLEGEEGDVGRHLGEAEKERQRQKDAEGKEHTEEKRYNRFPKQRDEDRKPRSMEAMVREAEMLARELQRDEESEGQSSSAL